MAQRSLSTEARGYGPEHRKRRELLAPFVASGSVPCARCGGLILPDEPWDLGHVDGSRSRYSGPEHARCNRATSGRWSQASAIEPEPERDGLPASDGRWDVPWLKDLRKVPANAVWPRLMTVPHPRAVGSLGPEFIEWAEGREGRPLRWFQRLAATRLLEVDGDGQLVWETMILSMARQLGKSWLLVELILWRIHQGERFGEPQLVLHTGKDVNICREVQRDARAWAKARPETYRVREVNGQEEIIYLADGSRWKLSAKEAVYGYSVSCAVADEAWKVKPESIDDALTPTMIERQQPQLLLVSTAHRLATALMLNRRKVALAQLELGDGDLLIEWSAPAGTALDDRDGWRLASPHWTPKRERDVEKALEAMYVGETDEDENDPEQAFRAQRLNQWPAKRVVVSNAEPLLPAGLWAQLGASAVVSTGPIWVAVEDDFGKGAAVAATGRTPDGRIELDGWLCPDWDSAVADVQRLGGGRQIRLLLVGASMLDRVPATMVPPPQPAGARETRTGLALLRDLAAGGAVVHEEMRFDLDDAFAQAQVKEQSSGLFLLPTKGPVHLVKAAVWAVQAAHRPAPVPVIY